MSAVRVWLMLLTILLGLATALVVCLPRTLVDDLDRESVHNLERSRRAAAMLLRLNARKWIDTAAHMAGDAVLAESLDEATRGPADLAIVHRTVQDRLKAFNEQMKVELVLATDARGRVIARVGVDAAVYKDGIEGYPLVADTLRGLRGDDTWSIGGKLYRVAASPVIQHDHYAGVVVLGQEVTGELAESMKKALDTEVVLLLHGRVIGLTSALPIVDRLPAAAAAQAHGDEPSTAAPLIIDNYAVAVASFAGEAGDQQAQYALIAPQRGTGPLPRIIARILPSDMKRMPWRLLAPVGAGALVLLILGLTIVSLFGSRPSDQLAREAQALSRGELQRLPEHTHSGPQRATAQAVNSIIERIAGRVRAEQRSSSQPNVDSRSSEPIAPTVATPMPSTQTPAPKVAHATSNLRAVADNTPKPLTERNILTEALGPATVVDGEFDEAQTSARVRQQMPKPKTFPSGSDTPLPPPAPASVSQPNDVSLSTGVPMAEPPMKPIDRDLSTVHGLKARGFDEPTTVESPSEEALLSASSDTGDDVEAEFRRVFDEFLATREQCGETLDGVTFDRFVIKLRQNRTQLIQRYGCTSVRFQVYVRGGKTALKATPVT